MLNKKKKLFGNNQNNRNSLPESTFASVVLELRVFLAIEKMAGLQAFPIGLCTQYLLGSDIDFGFLPRVSTFCPVNIFYDHPISVFNYLIRLLFHNRATEFMYTVPFLKMSPTFLAIWGS